VNAQASLHLASAEEAILRSHQWDNLDALIAAVRAVAEATLVLALRDEPDQ